MAAGPAAVSVQLVCALTAAGSSALRAEDEHHDQQAVERHDDHPSPRPEERRPEEYRPEGRVEPAIQYRHDHPGASARCHDGFFTRTTDRGRACSKHGGIDVWLVL
jgi:hypothetical protein